jgi:hypothetical protein
MNLVEIMMKLATENEVDSKHLKLWLVVSITRKLYLFNRIMYL